MTDLPPIDRSRRLMLAAAGGMAVAPLLASATAFAADVKPNGASAQGRSLPGQSIGRRRLGGLEVSSVGLGVQNMSRTYQTTIPNRPEMINIIRTAFDHDVTFFDSAEAYGPLEVERILAEAVAPFRDKVVIATKFGWNIDTLTGERHPGLNSRPEHIKLAVEAMLQRLRTDRIDLLYQHRVDPQIPIEDVAGAVKDLMVEGKVLHWGLCEMGLKTLRRAHLENPLTAVQSEYSMLWRGPEDEVLSTCQELGIGFVPWSPLGVGFLTGAIDAKTRFADGDIRKIEGRFSPENLAQNLQLVALLKSWADRKQASPGQIALAWLMAQKPWIVPIPGTTQMAHMLENIGAASIQLTSPELSELGNSVAAISIQGQRLPDSVLVYSGVESAPRP
ncbi:MULTISPECIES: aldo/keto reductase [Pseudomonas]|uniref:Aldo/keto reductase n=3 Tax=Pseudomonas savastanoi TaxID=29438 RepID=A0A267JRN5_PSESS|nr:aldo/keto reductase [Pseudomonas savastanoi pv. savastanoi NCPPB 3335]KAA3545347.1 aldo/keto reductase [Pseudomonas savastanoi]KPY68006.1 Aldo-keto reductase [Pseudomonas savastanoi pv. savastanoi]KUG40645.1 Aldo-keto reductase [Pseudomonas savastanoi pv. fraxini]PAB24553.1 aldo/keto reductase [Pseudomonas savastanoi pv. nerii]TSC35148.1 aldo/keto reductase [Pseudomonas sp. ST1]